MILKYFLIFFTIIGIFSLGVDITHISMEIFSCFHSPEIQYEGTTKNYCDDIENNLLDSVLVRIVN